MLTTYRQAYKTLVYAQIEDGKIPVGFFLDFVIDPETGNMMALWLQTLHGKKMLDPSDIIHWRSSEILIRNAADCFNPEDSPKLQRFFKKECMILGAATYSWPDKKNLGQVRNFGFDTISPRVLSLHIRPRWWQPWYQQIIPHPRIHSITPQGIFINDDTTLKATSSLRKVTKAIKSVEEIPKVDCEE